MDAETGIRATEHENNGSTIRRQSNDFIPPLHMVSGPVRIPLTLHLTVKPAVHLLGAPLSLETLKAGLRRNPYPDRPARSAIEGKRKEKGREMKVRVRVSGR